MEEGDDALWIGRDKDGRHASALRRVGCICGLRLGVRVRRAELLLGGRGTAGAETIGEAVTKPVLAREPGWIALLWATGVLKALGGLLALSLVQPWGRAIPRWMRLTAAWGAGALMFLYGGASMVQFALMAAGALSIPASVGATAVRWHLLLWEPWWMLGGLLFMAAAWLAGRRGM